MLADNEWKGAWNGRLVILAEIACRYCRSSPEPLFPVLLDASGITVSRKCWLRYMFDVETLIHLFNQVEVLACNLAIHIVRTGTGQKLLCCNIQPDGVLLAGCRKGIDISLYRGYKRSVASKVPTY
jgi:hypothetical protein